MDTDRWAEKAKRGTLRIARFPGRIKRGGKYRHCGKVPPRSDTRGQKPLDTGRGKDNHCPDCGNDWLSKSNKSRGFETIGGVVFDNFICKCGHKYSRFE